MSESIQSCAVQTTAARNVAEGLLDTLLTTQQPQQAAHNLLNATGVQATPPQRVVFFLGKQVPAVLRHTLPSSFIILVVPAQPMG